MYKVEANTLSEYFNAAKERKGQLMAMDALIRSTVPSLKRWFYSGVKAGEGGMNMKMIGYGTTLYHPDKIGDWPVIGLALQKNYISVYIAGSKDGELVVDRYRGKLGETRVGRNNFSFVNFDQLNRESLIS